MQQTLDSYLQKKPAEKISLKFYEQVNENFDNDEEAIEFIKLWCD